MCIPMGDYSQFNWCKVEFSAARGLVLTISLQKTETLEVLNSSCTSTESGSIQSVALLGSEVR